MAVKKKTKGTKRRGTKKSSPAASRQASGATASLRGRAGRAQRGVEWDPSKPETQAAASPPEINISRPYLSRYPISNEAFESLKAAAPKAKLPKATAERARDKGQNKVELSALAAAPVALVPGSEPVAAPSGSVNFAGITATGWLPPDCTLAVGPQHVLASVNSSLALYNKAGGAALMQKTLTQWFSNVVQGMTIFDPKALYDQHAGRWVLLAVAVLNNPKKAVYLLSVSNTSNPQGTWRNYSLNAMVDGQSGPVFRRRCAVLRFRQDEKSGRFVRVHHPALSHVRSAASRIPGQ